MHFAGSQFPQWEVEPKQIGLFALTDAFTIRIVQIFAAILQFRRLDITYRA